MELTLGLMIDRESSHNLMNIFSHFRLEEVLPADVQGLVHSKVICKGSSMGFPNHQLS